MRTRRLPGTRNLPRPTTRQQSSSSFLRVAGTISSRSQRNCCDPHSMSWPARVAAPCTGGSTIPTSGSTPSLDRSAFDSGGGCCRCDVHCRSPRPRASTPERSSSGATRPSGYASTTPHSTIIPSRVAGRWRHWQQREAEPWFDPAGFLLHERDGKLAAFCWTKVHADVAPPMGEIYVIAVDPEFHGLGLGKALTVAGLENIAARGLTVGMLHVDAANTAAMGLYDQPRLHCSPRRPRLRGRHTPGVHIHDRRDRDTSSLERGRRARVVRVAVVRRRARTGGCRHHPARRAVRRARHSPVRSPAMSPRPTDAPPTR